MSSTLLLNRSSSQGRIEHLSSGYRSNVNNSGLLVILKFGGIVAVHVSFGNHVCVASGIVDIYAIVPTVSPSETSPFSSVRATVLTRPVFYVTTNGAEDLWKR